nr:MAG TPA: Glutathione-dependent formaldehyde-activating enzyme [Caudoviricetes sp.]
MRTFCQKCGALSVNVCAFTPGGAVTEALTPRRNKHRVVNSYVPIRKTL